MSAGGPVEVAALAILEQHCREHQRKADEAKVHAVYVVGSHNPRPEASPAELAVERTLRDSVIARARFHSQEAERFARAIAEAKGAS